MRAAAEHELVPGAVIRVPAVPGLWQRPFGLRIMWREPKSRETGAIVVGGRLLAQDGTTTRKRHATRDIVVLPGRPVELISKAPAPEFTAKIAVLVRTRTFGSEDQVTRWGVVDADDKPLPGTGTGPAITQCTVDGELLTWTLRGDWEGKPTPWLARETWEQDPAPGQRRRDPIEQCIDRVRQERGILHVDRLTYDLSVWPHASAQELRQRPGDGKPGWHDTYVCKRCGGKLTWLSRSPWLAALEDGDEECHGETWIP